MIQIIVNDQFSATLANTFRLKEKEALKIFDFYAVEAVKFFLTNQGRNRFWTNQTYKAIKSFIATAFIRENEMVLRFAYDGSAINPYTNEEYTKYLETMNDGEFAALPTIIEQIAPLLIKDIKILYGDSE